MGEGSAWDGRISFRVPPIEPIALALYPVLGILWVYVLWPMVLQRGPWAIAPGGGGMAAMHAAWIFSMWALVCVPMLVHGAVVYRRPAAELPPRRLWRLAGAAASVAGMAYVLGLLVHLSLPCAEALGATALAFTFYGLQARSDFWRWLGLFGFVLLGYVTARVLAPGMHATYPSLYPSLPTLPGALYLDLGWIPLEALAVVFAGPSLDAAEAAARGSPREVAQPPDRQAAAQPAAAVGLQIEMRTRHERNPHAFEHLVGLDAVIEKLVDALDLPLREPERLARYQVAPPACFLLAGPPGTGKTALARAAAEYFGCAFFAVGPGDLIAGTGLVGLAEQRLKHLFAEARGNRPAVIFFDEIDAFAAARDGAALNRPQDLLLRPLLAELDGFDPLAGVLVLAASNAPELLDPALLRSGRFGQPIWVTPPDGGARARIWRVYLAGKPLAADVDVDELAGRSEGWVGADIASAVAQAAMSALKRGVQDPSRDRIEMADLRALLPSPARVARMTDRAGERG